MVFFMKSEKKYNHSVIVYSLLLLVAFFLQKTNIFFAYNSPAPNFILSVALIVAFFENYWYASIFGLICGILNDATSLNGFGQHALLYMLTGFFCSILLEWLFQNNFASFSILSLPIIIVHQLFEMIINSGFTSGIFTLYFKFYSIVILYTFLTSFILYLLFYFLIKRNTRFKKPTGIIKN